MLFKNLQLYSIANSFQPHVRDVEAALQKRPLLECSALAMQSFGWAPVSPGWPVAIQHGHHLLMSLGILERMLPASAIKREAKARAEILERQQGFRVGRKQLRDLEDKVADELRPRALAKEKRVLVWIDLGAQTLAVDTASPKVADLVTSMLRTDLGELPIVPLMTQTGAGGAMTNWLMAGAAPAEHGLSIDQDCELVGGGAGEATVRYARHDLHGAEVRSLIQGGKQVRQLGLSWRDRAAFVLTDRLVIKRVQDQQIVEQAADGVDAFSAELELTFGTLSGVIGGVVDALGGIAG
jgi:recombination associated protein RdgC